MKMPITLFEHIRKLHLFWNSPLQLFFNLLLIKVFHWGAVKYRDSHWGRHLLLSVPPGWGAARLSSAGSLLWCRHHVTCSWPPRSARQLHRTRWSWRFPKCKQVYRCYERAQAFLMMWSRHLILKTSLKMKSKTAFTFDGKKYSGSRGGSPTPLAPGLQ